MNNLIRLKQGQPVLDHADAWQIWREQDGERPAGPLILPWSLWQAAQSDEVLSGLGLAPHAVLLGPDDDPELLTPFLQKLPLIAIEFPCFRDGRAYSQAYLLRTRLGWQGELRAVGDVLRDQLNHMRQCGFDAFAVRADKSAADAVKGLAGMSVLYGRSAIEPRPLFRRGR